MNTEKKEKEVNQLPEGITTEMIANARKNPGTATLKLADLPLDDNGDRFLTVLVSVPNRKTMGEFEKWVDKNPDKSKEILINAHLHSHKDQVKADDGLFTGAFDAIVQLMPIRKAIIKNLPSLILE